MKFNPCRPCCTPTQCGTLTFRIHGCPSVGATGTNIVAFAGAVITVYDGNNNTFPVLASGTSDSSGNYVVPISTSKQYAYSISAPRFNTQNGVTATVPCTGVSNTFIESRFTLASATTTICSVACRLPLARTLHLNTPSGILTLIFGTNANSRLAWTVTASLACGSITLSLLSGGDSLVLSDGFKVDIASSSSGLAVNQVPTSITCPTISSPGSLAVTYTTTVASVCWPIGTVLTLTE